MIPNCGEMRRYGEPVSTAFVESTINEVIARRMAKKQRMQWSRKGAHYLGFYARIPENSITKAKEHLVYRTLNKLRVI